MSANHICEPLACKGTDVPDAITAPIFNLLFRQKPRFLAELVISGMSFTFFAFALDIRNEVIESIAANEMNWVIKEIENIFVVSAKFAGWKLWMQINLPYETIWTKVSKKNTIIGIKASICGHATKNVNAEFWKGMTRLIVPRNLCLR